MFRRITLVATLSAATLLATAPVASAADLSGLGALGPGLAGAVNTVVGAVLALL